MSVPLRLLSGGIGHDSSDLSAVNAVFPLERGNLVEMTASHISRDITSDSELVKRFLEGDEKSFDAIVKRHEELVRAILYRLAGNPEDAEDMAQETFIRVYGHLGRFRGESSLKTWILRIATNLARDMLRKREKRPPILHLEDSSLDALPGSRGESPPARLSLKEKTRAIAAALDLLPFKQRAALTMKVIGDMSYEEIASALDTTPNSVKSSTHLARKRLLSSLGDRL